MSGSFALNAATFGLRAIADHRRLFIALAVLHFVVSFVSAPALGPALGRVVDAWEGVAAAVEASSVDDGAAEASPATVDAQARADALAAMNAATLSLAGFIVAPLILLIITQAAILRALVRDDSSGGLYGVWLGGDEIRIAILSLVVALAVAGVFFVTVSALSFVGQMLGAPEGGASAGFIVGLAAVLWVTVRLTPIMAATVGEGALLLTRVWAMTRGYFAVLLFASAFAVVGVTLAGVMVSGLLGPAVAEPPAGGSWEQAYREATAGVLGRVRFALMAVLDPIFIAVVTGVGAYAYRVLGARAGLDGAVPPVEPPPPAPPSA